MPRLEAFSPNETHPFRPKCPRGPHVAQGPSPVQFACEPLTRRRDPRRRGPGLHPLRTVHAGFFPHFLSEPKNTAKQAAPVDDDLNIFICWGRGEDRLGTRGPAEQRGPAQAAQLRPRYQPLLAPCWPTRDRRSPRGYCSRVKQQRNRLEDASRRNT